MDYALAKAQVQNLYFVSTISFEHLLRVLNARIGLRTFRFTIAFPTRVEDPANVEGRDDDGRRREREDFANELDEIGSHSLLDDVRGANDELTNVQMTNC